MADIKIEWKKDSRLLEITNAAVRNYKDVKLGDLMGPRDYGGPVQQGRKMMRQRDE